MKVETEITEIPHKGGKLTFRSLPFRGNLRLITGSLDSYGLKRSSSSEIASLFYYAFQNPKGEYESELIRVIKGDYWIREFTGNYYLPKSNEEINNGVILESNPKITNGKLDMDKKFLIKRLQNNDSLVKFVPFGYKIGEQSASELMENSYIVERYGEEGAEKIAEIASKFKKKPRLHNYGFVNEEKVEMSALDGDGGYGDRLIIGGGYWDDNGLAFGIVP